MSRAAGGLVAAVAALGGLAAWRSGGADERHAPPVPVDAPLARLEARGAGRGAEADEVVFRLLEALGDARVDVPSLGAGLAALEPHWRKMRAPWTGLSGNAARMAVSLAWVASDEEKEYVVPLASGAVWKPDAHQWNMSEGSFDQRDAIFAPTPSSIAYRLSLPLHAAFTFTVAVDAAPEGASFIVRVRDARGATYELWSRTLTRREGRRWWDARVDLAEFGGQSIELTLATVVPSHGPSPASATGSGPALALWGDPVVVAREPTRVPYNVLWFVLDATRADALGSFHDDDEDAAKQAAPLPPEGALLPKIAGLTPALDDLARRGVRFTHAYSAASWTRPGTIAMLAGARSTELGLGTLRWQIADAEAARFYASDPPLLPLLLRRQGVVTRAFVNNYFMVGYAAVGVDMGFSALSDYRYRTRDTSEITTHATSWLRAHKDERFFLFCNLNSPHAPLDPPARFLARVPPPPAGPADPEAAKYLGEVAKDDEAVGTVLRALAELGLAERTLVVMTADHGETLSGAHDGVSALDHMRVRYHHSASVYEETTHVPILLSLPGALPGDAVIADRVRTIDLGPTVLDLEGLERPARMSGRTMSGLIHGDKEPEPRVVLSEGRGAVALLVGDYRLVSREGKAETIIFPSGEAHIPEELFDLAHDPGERRSILRTDPERAAEMRARLLAARHDVPVAASPEAPAVADVGTVSLRFAGAGAAHTISGAVWVDPGALLVVRPFGVAPESVRASGSARAEIAFATTPDALVGIDLEPTPATAPLRWALFLDDRKLDAGEVFAGAFGLPAPGLASGVTTDDGRSVAFARRPAVVDPRRDLGLFVTRARRAEPDEPLRGRGGAGGTGGAGAAEMQRLLRDWGYAHERDDAFRDR